MCSNENKGQQAPGVEVYGNAGSLLRPHCGHARLLVPDDQRLGADLSGKALQSRIRQRQTEVIYALPVSKSAAEQCLMLTFVISARKSEEQRHRPGDACCNPDLCCACRCGQPVRIQT